MTSVLGAKVEEQGAGPNSGSTTLHGRIEAIGIHDLLRVSMGKRSTGRLLVFNDTQDAEVYYEQGHLVAVICGASFGAECLQQVLQMQEGEFEFAVGLQTTAESKTPNLHEAMIGSIREHYEQQVRNRQSARAAGEEPRSSGVHKIEEQAAGPAPAAATPARNPAPPRPTAPRAAAPASAAASGAPASPKPTTPGPANATPQRAPAPTPSSSAVGATPPASGAKTQLFPGELGSAVIDASGRVLQRLGSLTQHEAALVALAHKLATRLGASLGARESQGLELHAAGEKSLFCIAAAEGIRISKISPDADPDSIWKQLKT